MKAFNSHTLCTRNCGWHYTRAGAQNCGTIGPVACSATVLASTLGRRVARAHSVLFRRSVAGLLVSNQRTDVAFGRPLPNAFLGTRIS